jgi:hypothetical protein
MSNYNESFAAGAVSPTSEAHISFVHKTSHIIEPSNAHLANIGVELLRPPADFTDSASVGAKILPPIPAALFMVLTGFLCVSLVKDRRLWLAALAGLLWAGQAGFHAIPQLAAHMSSQKHIQQKTPDNTACLYRVEDCCRSRSDIEGTQYIGLLHHLAAIPAGTMSLLLPASLPSYPAVICPAARAEQYIHFSPASTFAQLARGPPETDLVIITSFLCGGSLRAGPSGRRLM